MKRIRLWLMLMVCAWSVNGFAQDVARDILNEGQQLDEFGNPVQDDKKGQKTGRRYASIQNVKTIAGAINLLTKIAEGGMEK